MVHKKSLPTRQNEVLCFFFNPKVQTVQLKKIYNSAMSVGIGLFVQPYPQSKL